MTATKGIKRNKKSHKNNNEFKNSIWYITEYQTNDNKLLNRRYISREFWPRWRQR